MRQNGLVASFRDHLLAKCGGWRPPVAGEVQIFGLRVDGEPGLAPMAWEMLSETERERAGRMLVVMARDEFVLGRAALRCLTGLALDIEPQEARLETGTFGKPFVSGIHSNVTHSRGLIYVALCADAPVGIDAEWIDPALEALELAESNFLPEEASLIAAQSAGNARARLFCELWTRKEAVAKAYGCGLRVPLQKIIVPRETEGPAWIEITTEEKKLPQQIEFYVKGLPAPDEFVLSVATKGGTKARISRWNFHE